MPIKITQRQLNLYARIIVVLIPVILIAAIVILIWKSNPFSYFSTRCIDYRQQVFSRRLNDRLLDYLPAARAHGITVCKDQNELKANVKKGKLVKVNSNSRYIVEKMNYSYPYTTRESRELLEEIARRFRDKTSQKGLRKAKFYITSMTRLSETLKRLRKFNGNASENSPHLLGNAFDISYKRFKVRKMVLTNCDDKFLKEALAEVLFELREENRCWATYERGQSCYHVVAR